MSDAYGFLATIYQPLSRAVFGRDLIEANQVFSAFGRGKKSLIIGGGDGVAYRDWDGAFEGEYWDSSRKMADLAKVSLGKSKLEVNCGSWLGAGEFDVVFLPFVLDTMSDREIEKIVFQISECLRPGGRVVLSDFFTPRTFLQGMTQQLMILGFRLFTGHARTDLPDFEVHFPKDKWKLIDEKIWRKGWIRAHAYEPIKTLMN